MNMDPIKVFCKENMEKIKTFLMKHKNQLSQVLSYVLVAVAAASLTVAITVGVMNGSNPRSKISALEQLIAERYVGQLDPVLVGDAAAEAMIDALGDRWSYYISAEEYVAFCGTHCHHIVVDEPYRTPFFEGLRNAVLEAGDRIVFSDTYVLYLAKKPI